MEKILPNGEEVSIFKISNGKEEEKYIKGIILSSRYSHDLSHHGSPWYEKIYDVRGEDGNIYTGTCDHDYIGNYVFFRTPEDYIKYLQDKINTNYLAIYDLTHQNEEYTKTINELRGTKEKTKTNVKIKIKIKASN